MPAFFTIPPMTDGGRSAPLPCRLFLVTTSLYTHSAYITEWCITFHTKGVLFDKKSPAYSGNMRGTAEGKKESQIPINRGHRQTFCADAWIGSLASRRSRDFNPLRADANKTKLYHCLTFWSMSRA